MYAGISNFLKNSYTIYWSIAMTKKRILRGFAAIAAAAFVAASLLAFNSCLSTKSDAGPYSLIIHYYRYSKDYASWNAWVWASDPNGDGGAYSFSRPDRDGFATARVSESGPINEFGVIIRRSQGGNDWAEKDTGDDRFTKAREIWILQGDPAFYTEKPDTRLMPIRYAVADTATQVLVTLPKTPKKYDGFSVYVDGRKLAGRSAKGRNDRQAVITLESPITDPSSVVTVRDESGAFAGRPVTMRGILDAFVYTGDDLGLTYAASGSVFKVWAPTAQRVDVAIYGDAGVYSGAKVSGNETDNLTAMAKDSATGVWSASINGDLAGKYYMYRVEFPGGKINYGVDPYSKAVSANGQRSAIVDPASTNPANFRPGTRPAFSGAAQDAVIYELHVRDFSIDSNSGMKNKGKFLAFTERGTRNSAGVPTGVDHMVNLGITHVHLLPSFDIASVNELTVDDPASSDPKMNWGYDPLNYNVPEGSYSTDPRDPAARIREYKQMVQSLHDAGIRVIMDVVYNHTAATGGTPFDAIVPGYFYRVNDQGSLSNGSGCGNEVASERPMVRKYIVDSVQYWAREYGVDGFRFDLMAIIDRETMRQAVKALHRNVDRTIIIYGEPWQAGGSILPSGEQTNVGAQKGMGIAIFNDRIRGSIKGGSDDASKGFASGQPDTEAGIVNGVRGSVDSFTSCANESINYVTAHDNLNLWDKFALSWGTPDMANVPYSLIRPDRPLLENDPVKSVLLANGIVLTAQGVPFFQAGDEFLRSKFGNHNSYNAPDSVNQIVWENAGAYREVVNYYAGLIRLRKEHPAFRMNAKADMDKIEFLQKTDMLVAFTIGGNANGDSWRTILVAYNAGPAARDLELPAGNWTQVVNNARAGVDSLGAATGTLRIPPLSMVVLHD
jgi:pullulanase